MKEKVLFFDVKDKNQRYEEIKKSDIIVSMLPDDAYFSSFRLCSFKEELVTASYVSDEN